MAQACGTSLREREIRRWMNVAEFDLFRSSVAGCDGSAEIGGRDPEHFAFGVLGVEPEQGQFRKRLVEQFAAAADLAEQAAVRREMIGRIAQDAADHVEAVGAAVEGKLG